MDESQSVFNKDEKMLISVLVPLFFLQASEAFKSQHNDQISFDVFAKGKNCDLWLILLCRFYQTLVLWLDEPRLHDPNLFLPSLPPPYDPARLETLLKPELVSVCSHFC